MSSGVDVRTAEETASKPSPGTTSIGSQQHDGKIADEELGNGSSAPDTATNALEQWNFPRTNLWRFLATLFSFFVLGLNDAAFGALIPYLEDFYGINYTVVSLIFLAPFFGYTAAALLNNRIHMQFGQVGIAAIAPCCKAIAYVTICVHPPYPVIPIVLVFAGFGNGLEDAAWNAWVGNMVNANELLGFLHGMYGLGATVSPLIATSMITKASLQWYTFYYIMVGAAVMELVINVIAFRTATGAVHRAKTPNISVAKVSRTKEAMKNNITWICAFFLLGYVGVEVSLGGWLVEFMLRMRNADAFAAGMTATGFWLGLTVGRVILGFVTGRIGEKLAIALYLLLCMGLELMFWLIPSFISSAVFSGFLGFFLGPLFPAAIVVATKCLPRHLHVSAIGFAAAFGGGGAAVLPFAVGAIAQAKGVQVLQPIVLAFLAVILALWCSLPGGFRKKGLDEVQTHIEGGTETHALSNSIRRIRKRVGMM